MTHKIYSSLDKAPLLDATSEVINLGTPTIANQRLMAEVINKLLDTCEVDATPSVQEFAERFIGEPVGLGESSEMLRLYGQIHKGLAQKSAQRFMLGDYTKDKEIEAGYRLAYWFYQLMRNLEGIALMPFREEMRQQLHEAMQRQRGAVFI